MIKISFLGDISLNDSYIDYYKSNINPFESLQATLFKSDFVIGNLECLTKGDNGENVLKKPRLTTTVKTLNYLKNINLKIATLAHNHIYDHLESGFIKTVDFLEENNIQHIGAGLSEAEANKHIIINENDISIAVLNYVTSDTNPNLPKDAKVYLNYFDLNKTKRDIENLKGKVNHIVIILHWGGRVEGGLFPDFDQPKIAKALIDFGADLIVGHHSHTIQPFEKYKGKYIFYSLGNFAFSNYEFEGKKSFMSRRRRITMILNISFNKTDYTLDTIHFENEGEFYTQLMNYKIILKLKYYVFRILFISRVFWIFYYIHKIFILPVTTFMIRNDLSPRIKIKRIYSSLKRRI